MSRDALALLSARVVSALTTVAVLAIVARLEAPVALGIVALGLTIGLALAVISEAGLTALLIREVARDPERSGAMLTALLLSRAIALPCVMLVAGLLLERVYPGDAGLILLVAIGPAIQQVGELGRSIFIARRRIPLASAHSIVENIGWFAAIAIGVTTGSDLTTSFIAAAVTVVVIDIAVFVLLRLILGVRFEWPRRRLVRDLIGRAGPFVAFGTLIVIAARADTLLIAALLPNGLPVAGAYFAAARLVAAGEYVPEAVGRAIYPELSRRFQTAPATVADVLAPAARQLLLIGLLIPFGIILVGPWAFTVVYGPELSGYGWILVALACVLPFRYMSILFGVALTSTDAQAWRTISLAIAVAIAISLEIILIPVIGVMGAVIGVYTVWMLTAALSIAATWRTVGPVIRAADVLAPLAIGSVGFAAGRLVAIAESAWAAPLSGVVYGVVVGLLLAGWLRRSSRWMPARST